LGTAEKNKEKGSTKKQAGEIKVKFKLTRGREEKEFADPIVKEKKITPQGREDERSVILIAYSGDESTSGGGGARKLEYAREGLKVNFPRSGRDLKRERKLTQLGKRIPPITIC